MKIRSKIAQLLVPVFVIALLSASATPALGIADNTNFVDCAAGGADADNCIVSFTGGDNDPDNNAGLDLNVFFSSGMLQIQVVDADNSDDQDIGAGNIDTEFSMTIEVTNNVDGAWDPLLVVGTGEISTWTWNAATNQLTITATPEAVSFAIPVNTNESCSSSEGDYDTGGECTTADDDFGAMLMLAADNGSTLSELTGQGFSTAQAQEMVDFFTAYTGGYVATDAQEFGIPTYDANADAIQFDLAAPHFMSNGTSLNTGFFNILIPEPVWTDVWGLTFDQNDPPDIGATADGSSLSLQTPVFVAARTAGSTTLPAAWLIKTNTITYSSPTIKVSPALATSVVEDQPTELDLGTSTGTGPVTVRVPVVLPDTGEFTREVTLTGPGAKLEFEQGTKVMVGGLPFAGTIDPPARAQGRPGGLRSAVTITATATDDADSATALADDEVVFDPPVTITIVDTTEEAARSRVVRIAPDGSITDLAGTMTGRGVTAQITGLGTYGLATELDLAEIASAPSIIVALPVRLPADGVIEFPLQIENDTAAVSFVAGTTVRDTDGEAFTGLLAVPSDTTAPDGYGQAVEIGAADGTPLTFDSAAVLTFTLPEGTLAVDTAPVRIDGAQTTCLPATTFGDIAAVLTQVTTSGTFGLALPLVATPQAVIREYPSDPGLHSRWAGQSAAVELCPGQAATVSVRLRNTGTTPWAQGSANPVVLAARDVASIESGLVVAPLYDTRLATHTEESVAPGAIGTFTFKVRAPATVGEHRIGVLPVAEGLRWLEDEGIHLLLTVR